MDRKEFSLRLSELTQDQRTTLHEFLLLVKVNEETAMQFLYARKFDLDRAVALYQRYESKLDCYGVRKVTFVDILPELKTGKLVIPWSRDRQKAGLLIFHLDRHDPSCFPPVSTLALTFYLVTILIQE